MKKIPLILGSIILIFIVLIMITPKTFAPKSPYTIQQLRFSQENGKLNIESAPYPPSDSFILGSDDLGRDILSYIIYGTRLTISLALFIAIFQFLIGIPLALYAGFGNELSQSIIKQMNTMFSAIPALLISIILLRLDYFTQLNKQNSIIAFIIVLTLVAWPKIAFILMERVEAINKQAFIKGAIAIGKKRKHIALTNVLPHLAPEIIVLFFMEIARNLSMIMQLGVFAVFVGNLKVIKDSTNGILTYYDVSFEPEWSSMLATSSTYIRIAPWAVIFPAFAFFISVLGFNLFGEGLREVLQVKDSNILSKMRGSLSIANIRQSSFKHRIAILVIALIVIVLTTLNLEEYKVTKDEDINIPYQQVMIGDSNRDACAELVIDYMKSIDIKPLEEEEFILMYDISESFLVEDQSFELSASSSHYEAGKDFRIVKHNNQSDSGYVYNATRDDLYNIKDYSVFEDKFILLDSKFYNDVTIDYIVGEITKIVDIKGLLIIREKALKSQLLIEESEYPYVELSEELGAYLAADGDIELTLEASLSKLESVGKNIVGIKEGSDPNMSEEAIMIGFNYNYVDKPEVLRFNLSLMKTLTEFSNKRSLIFMFVDGTMYGDYNGIRDVADDFPYSSQKIKAYIDLTHLKSDTYNSLIFSSKQAPLTRAFAWSIGHQLDKELVKSKIEIEELDTLYIDNEYYFTENDTDNMMFWDKGIATIIISNNEGIGNKDLYDLGEDIVEVISLNNY